MSYRIWSDEEIANRNLIAEGDYVFSCINAVKKTPKSGNGSMWEVKYVLKDMNGVEKTIRDWLMLEGEMSWKLSHLARTMGLHEIYKKGELKPELLIGKRGYLKLGKRINDKTGQPVNIVVDYLLSTPTGYVSGSGKNVSQTKQKVTETVDSNFDDSIPF